MKIIEVIKGIDIFGVGIEVNLRGKKKSGTLFGGFFTVLCMMGLLAYFGTLVTKIV
jgi:hypothetical protein